MTREELEAEVTKIKDYQEIQNLQARYGYYIQRGPWADWDGEVCSLFTDDAQIEISDSGVYVGIEGVNKVFSRNGTLAGGRKPQDMYTFYQIMPYIKIYDDGTASALWSLVSFLSITSKDPLEKPAEPLAVLLSGRYEMNYRKVNGTWKISKLTFRQYFRTPYEQGWSKIPAVRSWRNPFIVPDRSSTEYRPYNPRATCREEQLSDPALPPDKK